MNARVNSRDVSTASGSVPVRRGTVTPERLARLPRSPSPDNSADSPEVDLASAGASRTSARYQGSAINPYATAAAAKRAVTAPINHLPAQRVFHNPAKSTVESPCLITESEGNT